MKKLLAITAALVLVFLLFTAYVAVNVPIYPIWANKVTRSLSMREVSIDMSTGKVNDGEFEPTPSGVTRRTAELKLAQAYITWRSFLNGDVKSNVNFDAALPDLTPNTVWKADYLSGIESENGSVTSEDKTYAHKQWVEIKVHIMPPATTFITGYCKTPCTREVHQDKVMARKLGLYDILVSTNKKLGLKHYRPTSDSGEVWGHDFYRPISDLGYFSIDCGRNHGKFRWCDVFTTYKDEFHLNYQFEISHLEDWKNVDFKVRALLSKLIISTESEIF